jgi:hypothetical protein
MTFTDAVKAILAVSTGQMTPQQIREQVRIQFPQYYGTPAHARTVQKKQCQNLDHALLSEIYSLIRTNKAFTCDKTCKPMKVSLVQRTEKDPLPAEITYGQLKQNIQKDKKPEKPTPTLITEYLERWNTSEKMQNYRLQEESLRLLFKELCPENKTIEHILLKVSVLNDFYSTNIFDTYTVAKHILSHCIDTHLHNRNCDIVNVIAATSINGKAKNFYSFASKYCSHHNPEAFPIYDSFVDKMLQYYRKKDRFCSFNQDDLKTYSKFRDIIEKFKEYYGLADFSLRQIDIFLWLAGKECFPKKY